MLSQRALSRSAQLLGRRMAVRAAPRRQYSAAKVELKGAQDNAFNRERAAVKQHAAESSETWRKLSLYVAIPALLIASANAWRLWNEHWEHVAHGPPKEEKPAYPYLNIRTKNFFWGDGDKTLFWNSDVNYHRKDDE